MLKKLNDHVNEEMLKNVVSNNEFKLLFSEVEPQSLRIEVCKLFEIVGTHSIQVFV